MLLFAFFGFYLYVGAKFNGVELYKEQISELEWKLKNQELKTEISRYQAEDYRQYLAGLLPDVVEKYHLKLNPESNQQLRNFASVVIEPDHQSVQIDSTFSQMIKAKKAFSEKQYSETEKILRQLILERGDSPYVVEAYFLLIESEYQLQDYDNCIEHIDSMMSLYPENQLTGFALLRLGKILESQDRYEDAAQIYKAVQKSFKLEQIKHQADNYLKSIEL